MMRRVAAIDIGTNSTRSIVAEASGSDYRIIDDEKAYTRLGQARDRAGRLSAEAIERTVEALARMLDIARSLGAEQIRAVATAAVRDAPNASVLVDRAAHELGLGIEVISAQEEAHLAYVSARANIPLVGVAAVIDLGGGSLEIVHIEGSEARGIVSLPLGAVVLSERYGLSDPAMPRELKRLTAYVRSQLTAAGLHQPEDPDTALVGSGGTVNALAAMTVARAGNVFPSLQGFEMTRADVVHLLARLKRSTAEERARIPGMPQSRIDIIIPGAVVVAETLAAMGANRLVLNAKGMREGIILEMLGLQRSAPARSRRDAAAEFAERFRYDPAHAEQVSKLALTLFEQLKTELDLREPDRELLEAAAIMHDVGYYLSYDRHHKQSHHLIANSELRGFTPRELKVVAAVARYHRGSMPKSGHEELAGLDKRDRKLTIALSAILRIADGMDRARSGKVDSARVENAEDVVRLVLVATDDSESDLGVDSFGAQDKSDLLARLLKKPVEVRVETAT